MWSTLRFDGYKQIRWSQSAGTNNEELEILLNSVMPNPPARRMALDDIATMDDARQFAHDLSRREGTLASGWYTRVEGEAVSNYFVYVMNLEEKLLIKLSLLT